MKIYNHIKEVLEQNEKFCKDGRLFKNVVVEAGLKLDPELLSILLSDETARKYFFAEVNGVAVFDKVKFQKFVSNKQFLPDSYTAFKNKIGLTANREYLTEANEVVLDFPYKDCVLEGGQTKEDQKRQEIFWNETLAPDEIDRLFEPKVLTNWKRYDKTGEHEVKNISLDDNLIIKGNNLIALHSLEKQFAKKVKLIYIDPPYNTGGNANIFTYNNTFNHSTWLTFMENRLEIGKQLLRDDGFIAIAIDHYELFYLGTLADEIFGRDNRLGIITVVHKPDGRQFAKFFGASTEYMFIYAKNQEQAKFNKTIIEDNYLKTFNLKDEKGKYKLENFIMLSNGEKNLRINKPKGYYPIYVSSDLKHITLEKKIGYYEVYPVIESGQERTWKTYQDTFKKKLIENAYIAKKNKSGGIEILEKYRINKGQTFKTHWVEKKYNATTYGTRLLEKIIGRKSVSFPKSLYTVLDTLKITTNKDDIILDFFAGSGTTGHAVLALNKEDGGNRKFILVEQLDKHIEVCKERIQKVLQQENINDSFIYFELAQHTDTYKKKIENSDNDSAFEMWQELKKKPHVSYRVDFQKRNSEEFQKLSLDDKKEILKGIIDKNMLYIPYAEMNDTDYQIEKEDKNLTNKFYKL